MSSENISLGSEDVGSSGEASINVRDSHIQTMNNIMVSHEKESFKLNRDTSLSPVKQNNSDSEEEESIEDSEEDYKHKHQKRRDDSEGESREISSMPSDMQKFSSDEESEYQGEVYNVDGPVQLVRISDDLSSFEV